MLCRVNNLIILSDLFLLFPDFESKDSFGVTGNNWGVAIA
jgi:hypothetical protein